MDPLFATYTASGDALATAINGMYSGFADSISTILTDSGPIVVGVLSAFLGARWIWRKFTKAAAH